MFPTKGGYSMFTLLGVQASASATASSAAISCKIGAFGAGLTLADMLRLRAAAGHGRPAASQQVRHHDLPARRPVAHGHVRPQARRARRSSAASSSRSPPTSPACRSASTSRCRPRMWDKLAVHPLPRLRRRALRLAGHDRLQRERQPHRPSPVVRLGRVASCAAAPTPTSRPSSACAACRVGTEPGFLGIAHRPFTPDGPGLQNLRLASGVDADRLDDRKDLLASFDDVRRDIDATGTMTRHRRLHRPRLRHGRLRRRPQRPRPDQGRRRRSATATRASSSS